MTPRETMKRDPTLTQIRAHLVRKVPQAKVIIFFGSRVIGQPDALSDFDVLVLVSERMR